ncbi:MAG: hypothetical protein ACUVTD_06800 [Nitrososphaerales archaeon]
MPILELSRFIPIAFLLVYTVLPPLLFGFGVLQILSLVLEAMISIAVVL